MSTYKNFVTQDGVVYPADENNEVLYFDALPEGVSEDDPYVLKRTQYMGQEEDESTRKKYYTVGSYYHNGRTIDNWKRLRWAGYHRTPESRLRQKIAYETILGGDNISKYEEMLANGEEPVNLTMRDLRRKDIQDQLLQMEYDSYNDAFTVRRAFRPELEKFQPGHFERVGNTFRSNRGNASSSASTQNNNSGNGNKRPCKNCKQQAEIAQQGIRSRNTSFGQRTRSRGPQSWLQWQDASAKKSNAYVQTHETPGDMVDIYKDTYAFGKPLEQEDYDVTKTQTPPTTSTTSAVVKPGASPTKKTSSTSSSRSTGSSGSSNKSAPRKRISVSSSSTTGGGGFPGHSASTATNVTTQPVTTTEHRKRIRHPFTGEILSDELISIDRNGGNLNYANYFYNL